MAQVSEEAIVVELQSGGGVRQVSRTPAELATASAEAVDRAMETINAMAQKTKQGIDEMSVKPNALEITFGIKLTAEAGAIITKVGGEASLQVKLAWNA